LALIDTGNAKFYVKDVDPVRRRHGRRRLLPRHGSCRDRQGQRACAGPLSGMIVGANLYMPSFDRIKAHVLDLVSFSDVRMPDITGMPDTAWCAALAMRGGVLLVDRTREKARGRIRMDSAWRSSGRATSRP
jgi:uncharacterized protein